MAIARLESDRLVLEPLRVEHADELAPVLDDQKLHEFIGGRPASAEELRARFARQTSGSPDPSERWLNWVVRLKPSGAVAGTAHATVRSGDQGATADLAWVIATAHHGQGLAKEAAGLVSGWLRAQGIRRLARASIPTTGHRWRWRGRSASCPAPPPWTARSNGNRKGAPWSSSR